MRAALLLAICLTGCAALDRRFEAPHPTGIGYKARGDIAAAVSFATFLGAVAASGSNDKAAHALAGFSASFGCGLLMKPLDGFTCGFGLGVAKEAIDDRAEGNAADEKDLYATGAGAALAYGVLRVMEWAR